MTGCIWHQCDLDCAYCMAVDKLGQTNTLRFEMNRLAGRHRNHRRTRFGEDKNAGGDC